MAVGVDLFLKIRNTIEYGKPLVPGDELWPVFTEWFPPTQTDSASAFVKTTSDKKAPTVKKLRRDKSTWQACLTLSVGFDDDLTDCQDKH
ncbi:MAG: hypothetical protein RRA32_07260 [bacterium]|nr:hypothetical protein [bacterium]